MSGLWYIFAFLLVICVLVFVHEYGHFWAARKCGIKVLRFSIGFGKVLWSKTDKQGTEFAISMIPLGGYVNMLDSKTEAVCEDEKAQDYSSKPVWQRAFVIAAGPMANFIFAILAYWVIYIVGVPAVKPVIDSVVPDSIAAQAGLQPEMQIRAIDGKAVEDWTSVNMLLTTKVGTCQVTLTVSPFDQPQQLQDKRLDLTDWRYEPQKQAAFTALGMVPKSGKVDLTVSKITNNSPAAAAGLRVGDKIMTVNGEVLSWQALVQTIGSHLNQPLLFEIERHQQRLSISITPEVNKEGNAYIGFSPTFEPLAQQYRTELKYDILSALQQGLEKTAELSLVIVKLVGKLLSGDISLNNIGGPISIAQGAGISLDSGLVYYLSFMALISVNLGIMNLFPLPVLDGGQLVFLALEAIRGKPVTEKVREIFLRIGVALLLMLTIFALFNDIIRFI
ncbi:sigma E protease regulator RseP [Testudinibacter sp. TR-2022]|uniref:sigma E protease regulator RseP n=1 Tax=Testudinibacter sp. TR-2022 TaxID=2585029 RepID=UPI00111B16DB|nr:sigma E protease regulator RseP [Testudinibacter sp. TR-2022]TNH05530.1 sigma E protease regulator RseP [Pasteurellaceae bacterium Phil31]TNH11562.1 sigma E protease regulator RseP [Testudinibacter sp. TR-2022]TNH11929.1 sigma E protease regulator RseP [Testudinibacter sp. TR-2022]TNH12645.1 sigma E protease regulator RseP [Testudinibacter sp. TR-2022]TNH18039.1 sigma E protease regulator RseP [Testudinibacter sp. TR-2022]